MNGALDTQPAIAAVVPCYNAGPRVRLVVEGLLATTGAVWLVDDGSTDGAVDAVRSLPIRIIAFPENRGKGHALLAGFRAALEQPEIEAVAVVDADGQHDPAELPKLVAAFREQRADLVIGERAFGAGRVPWRSRLGNRLTAAITLALLGRRLRDTQSGFRLHGRGFLEAVVASVPGGRYETEMEVLVMAVREGWRVVSVPISTIYEAGNPTSHFGVFRDSFRIYRRLFRAALRRQGRIGERRR